MRIYHNVFNKIICLENLLLAWQKFKSGKSRREEVKEFWFHLEDNLFNLFSELKTDKYRHGSYESFFVKDPKSREIHKAKTKDRIVHQAIHQILVPIFEPTFIYNSYSSRKEKGCHKAVYKFEESVKRATKNNQYNYWIVKCDIKKFFNSIDHQILISLIEKKIKDKLALKLIKEILSSFDLEQGKGLPLGNTTSQLFANIYLNELDKFVKENLKVKFYIRYNDDFVLIHQDKDYLEKNVFKIKEFLRNNLKLNLPEDKTIFRKYSWGTDFLGYVIHPNYVLPKKRNRRRLIKIIQKKLNDFNEGKIAYHSLLGTTNSYLGLLKHSNSYNLKQKIKYLTYFNLYARDI